MSFNAGIFTADFWGTAQRNAVIMAANKTGLGSVAHQVTQCILVMMWVFIGIEGASVMSNRAKKKSEAPRPSSASSSFSSSTSALP